MRARPGERRRRSGQRGNSGCGVLNIRYLQLRAGDIGRVDLAVFPLRQADRQSPAVSRGRTSVGSGIIDRIDGILHGGCERRADEHLKRLRVVERGNPRPCDLRAVARRVRALTRPYRHAIRYRVAERRLRQEGRGLGCRGNAAGGAFEDKAANYDDGPDNPRIGAAAVVDAPTLIVRPYRERVAGRGLCREIKRGEIRRAQRGVSRDDLFHRAHQREALLPGADKRFARLRERRIGELDSLPVAVVRAVDLVRDRVPERLIAGQREWRRRRGRSLKE